MAAPILCSLSAHFSGGPSDAAEAETLSTSLRDVGVVEVVSRWHEPHGEGVGERRRQMPVSADVLIVLERPVFSASVLADCLRATKSNALLVLYAPEGRGRGMREVGFKVARSPAALHRVLKTWADQLGELSGGCGSRNGLGS